MANRLWKAERGLFWGFSPWIFAEQPSHLFNLHICKLGAITESFQSNFNYFLYLYYLCNGGDWWQQSFTLMNHNQELHFTMFYTGLYKTVLKPEQLEILKPSFSLPLDSWMTLSKSCKPSIPLSANIHSRLSTSQKCYECIIVSRVGKYFEFSKKNNPV